MQPKIKGAFDELYDGFIQADKQSSNEDIEMQPKIDEAKNQKQKDKKNQDTKMNSMQVSLTTHKYIPGSFSLFAIKQQNEDHKRNSQIKMVVQEALTSHLKKVDQIKRSEKQMTQQSLKLQKQLLKVFKTRQILNRFIQNPIEWYLQQQKFTDIQSYINHFVFLVMNIRKYGVCQGKLFKYSDFNMKKYLKFEDEMYVQSKNIPNTFLRINSKQLEYRYLVDGKLKHKGEVIYLSERERQIMSDMIMKYFQATDLKVNQNEIKKQIIQIINHK